MGAKSVQELSMNGQELPQNYIYKDSDGGIFDASLPIMEIPIIDIALITSPSSSKEELEKLRSALSFWGCFQAMNHGIEKTFLDKVREVTKQFFALPQEKKLEYTREDGGIEGYGNDMIVLENQTLDWTDRLYLSVSPKDQRQLKYWPENPETFREILHQYTEKTEVMIEIMSNGIFKSPMHRVVTNRERERISLAMFFTPNSDREIEPVNGLADETRPRLYKKVKDYCSFYFQYYQRGLRPIEAAMI
ncbi:hypothetical protein Pint_13827 [Pistacia integerrima]|uniref:Uncharacterized protein n=1 Tax=Pistacia integerrima TaxID=434235 RepID=A0ACC0Y6L8_9ROSI|nr:hypothetical protein Pint_13827 [Pistacia integerrima]